MKFIRLILLLIATAVVVSVHGQSEEKIDKKLSKLYQNGKIVKCEKKALKFRKKNPGAAPTYYYLSKIEIYASKQIANLPNKKQYTHINKAANYSRKVKEEYPDWYNEVKYIYGAYIDSWPEFEAQTTHVKKIIKNYEKLYNKKPEYILAAELEPELPENEIPEISVSLKRQQMVDIADDLIGLPYKYAGTSPETGFDCSGFTQYVYKQVGIDIPHNSHMQSQLKGKTLKLEDALPGDLIIFGSGDKKKWRTQHTALIYENKNGIVKVIHSVSRGVCIDGDNPSWESYWKERILFVKRIPELK